MALICRGNGECLTQTTDENCYEKYPDYTCDHNCRPIPCCNEIVCGSQLPPWFHGLKKAGTCLCIPCDMQFGKKLGVVESAECPICLETKTGVIMPNCTHSICVGCFKRCMYGKPSPQPPFPYPDEIFTEWEEGGGDNPEWCASYPLAKVWDEECDRFETARAIANENEVKLRKCPLCRR